MLENIIHKINSAHYIIFLFNIALFLLAQPIVKKINNDPDKLEGRVWGFRVFNLMFFVLHGLELIFEVFYARAWNYFYQVSYVIGTLYAMLLLNQLGENFFLRKFGEEREIDGQKRVVESYSSRMVQILWSLSNFFLAIVIVLQILGLKGLFETTGLIGIVLGLFALTSSIWAPDIFHGLTLLNSKMLGDGDIILIEDVPYVVFKTSFFETVLLNIKNNHRTRMRNSILANHTIDTLTRLADAQGARETLTFNIGYPKNETELQIHEENIDKMFHDAYENCTLKEHIPINQEVPPEIFLIQTGDYALTYSFSFYLKHPKKSKVAKEARAYLRVRYLVQEEIFRSAIRNQVDLSTPVLLNTKTL